MLRYSLEGDRQTCAYRRGSKRKAAAEAAFNSVGAKLESLYFTFGDEDVVAIVDGPDNATMAAVSFAINASGAVTLKTTVLLAGMIGARSQSLCGHQPIFLDKRPGYTRCVV